jgi:[FeFe] hydrogenase (group B1/B3)
MLVLQNETTYLRRDLSAKILKIFFDETIEDEIDKIPVLMTPKDKASMRCCLYKDRAVLRYRIMALLGMSIENDDDETVSLKDFYKKALQRTKIDNPVLTVLDTACSSCLSGQYHVTEICRGCVARPCKSSCPKNAISLINGRSIIDTDLCVSCGKCKQVCPYNAIIYTPMPCEEKCPVGAITTNEAGYEEIDYDKCIYCGKCTRACPFGAVMERSQIIDVAKNLKDKKQVIAMVAPSIIGQLPGTPGQLFSAIKKLGFSDVIEVAEGAEQTAREEAQELKERLAAGDNLMGTSCCPAYVEAVNKHVPEFKKFVSHTKSPMAITATKVNEQYPKAIKVFIGPCIAKKVEGINDVNVDFVLTFEELGAFFVAKHILVQELPEASINKELTDKGRGFAVSKGVTAAVQHYYGEDEINSFLIDGLDKKGLKQLELATNGKISAELFEVMTCEGGCLYGPGIICNPQISRKALDKFLQECEDKAKVVL